MEAPRTPALVARVRFPSAAAFDRHCRKYATPSTFVLATAATLPLDRDIDLRVISPDGTSFFEARSKVIEKIPNGYRLALLDVSDAFRARLAAATSTEPTAPAPAPIPVPKPQGLVPGSASAMPWNAPVSPSVPATPRQASPVPSWLPAGVPDAPAVHTQAPPAVPVFMPKTPPPAESSRIPVASPAPVAPSPSLPSNPAPRSPILVPGLAAAGVAAVAAMFFFVSVDLPGRAVAESTVTPVPAASAPPPAAVPATTPDNSAEVAALTEKGMAALNAGDEPAATAFFEQALALDPDHARAHLGVGTASMLRGDNDAAKSSLVKFIALAPEDPLAAQTRTLLEAL